MLEPTSRFSNRVSDYVLYRPEYPASILSALKECTGFKSEWTVADIGSGTGKLSELFLNHGCKVSGVEPNREMREAAERLFAQQPNFHSIEGTAEHTGLPERSFDLVAAGQAFHWFEPEATKVEFRRILSEKGWVVLIWNDRQVRGAPFLDAYESLLQTLPEYRLVGHKTEGAMKLKGFFAADPITWRTPNRQDFDWQGLRGRALSSSYVPPEGDGASETFMRELREIFDKHSEDGKVTFFYETQLFMGKL